MNPHERKPKVESYPLNLPLAKVATFSLESMAAADIWAKQSHLTFTHTLILPPSSQSHQSITENAMLQSD